MRAHEVVVHWWRTNKNSGRRPSTRKDSTCDSFRRHCCIHSSSWDLSTHKEVRVISGPRMMALPDFRYFRFLEKYQPSRGFRSSTAGGNPLLKTTSLILATPRSFNTDLFLSHREVEFQTQSLLLPLFRSSPVLSSYWAAGIHFVGYWSLER